MKKEDVFNFLGRHGWSGEQIMKLNDARKKFGYPPLWEKE